MAVSVFGYTNYKLFLKDKINSDKSSIRGIQKKIANHIHCQPSYLTQVLKSKAQISLEQAVLISDFFSLDKIETKYFVLLVQMAKAANSSLSYYFEQELEDLRCEISSVSKRLKDTHLHTTGIHSKYYSSWHYSAIHVHLAIPKKHSAESISNALGISLSKVSEAIEFLSKEGLITQEKDFFILNKGNSWHLSKDSENIKKHYTNWRLKSIDSVNSALDKNSNLHYSSVISISSQDAQILKSKMVEYIAEMRKTIIESKEEKTFALNMDFFDVQE